MLRSMTACGRAQKCTEELDLLVEIHSHNKRGLDVSVKLPHELAFLDWALRKEVQGAVERGSVTVSLQAVFRTNSPFDVMLNRALIDKIQKAAPHIDINVLLPIVAREFPIVQITAAPSQESHIEALVIEVLREALQKFREMKEQEGSAIVKEFEERLNTLQKIVHEVQRLSGGAEEKYRAKLQKRLHELLPELDHDERIAKEVALLAERLDVSEEISRLRMHIASFTQALGSASSEGKKLEFIVQEMLRELNTIGSKAQDGLITDQVILGKCEIEKIREQVMNVE